MNKKSVIITVASVLILACLFAFARTTTTDLGLVKPIWEEDLDILTDINDNTDILEAFANDVLEFDLSPVLRAPLDISTFNIEGVDATEFGYLDGVTSDVQTQFGLRYLKTEMDSFSELQAIIADKTLVNEEDGITATAITDDLILKADFADGDWGDMTVATNVVTIDADAVTYAKIQNVSATDKVLGRSSAGAGIVEEITCTSAGRALIDDADASTQRTTLGLVIGIDVEVDLSNEAGLYAVLSDVTLFLEDVIDDTTPELGGEMDAGANTIGFTQQTVSYNVTTTTVDWTNGNKATMTFGAGNIGTFAFTNPTNPCNVLVKIIQDATGSRVVTAWDADIKWAGGTAPTLTTTANGIDICSFYWDGTNYFGVASLAFATP